MQKSGHALCFPEFLQESIEIINGRSAQKLL